MSQCLDVSPTLFLPRLPSPFSTVLHFLPFFHSPSVLLPFTSHTPFHSPSVLLSHSHSPILSSDPFLSSRCLSLGFLAGSRWLALARTGRSHWPLALRYATLARANSTMEEQLRSPLQQLERQTAQARRATPSPTKEDARGPVSPSPMNFDRDRDSIYSFDSVSTNGRLLDRLGLESDDLFDPEELARLDRLSISDVTPYAAARPDGRDGRDSRLDLRAGQVDLRTGQVGQADLRQWDLPRERTELRNPFRSKDLERMPSKGNEHFMIRSVGNVVHPSRNKSIDSFHIDVNNKKADIDEYDDFNFSSNSSSESLGQKPANYGPLTRNRSVSLQPQSQAPVSPTRRTVSDNLIKTSPNGKLADLTPEARTKLSLQLRGVGKHREASYQLQLAANAPYNYEKAMYMYAMALKLGQGVRQNDISALKWLCKCIAVNGGKYPEIIAKINEIRLEDLLKLVKLEITTCRLELEPFKLHDYYASQPANHVQKLAANIKNQLAIVPLVYQELGLCFINGWGVGRDELLGMKCLAIAASMGNFKAMNQLGELWLTKLKAHKKDSQKAAAWLRLAEVFGSTSIGNSWIYKDKYMGHQH